jgi:two-component system sensor histidine kinase MprB
VEVRVRDGCLQVRDHGPGIAAEDLPRVFDRFYRSSSARGLPGSGLGLAIVRQVAEMHDGSVHAVNDPGGGARLTFELPALMMTDAELAVSEPVTQPVAGAPASDVAVPGATRPHAASFDAPGGPGDGAARPGDGAAGAGDGAARPGDGAAGAGDGAVQEAPRLL